MDQAWREFTHDPLCQWRYFTEAGLASYFESGKRSAEFIAFLKAHGDERLFVNEMTGKITVKLLKPEEKPVRVSYGGNPQDGLPLAEVHL